LQSHERTEDFEMEIVHMRGKFSTRSSSARIWAVMSRIIASRSRRMRAVSSS
jgi:hypothetical protein